MGDTGRVWLRGALSAADLAVLGALDLWSAPGGTRLGDDLIARVMALPSVRAAIAACAPGYQTVRAVAFSKSSGSNWALPWHQDRVIAVAERHDIAGFGAWTRKSGYWHCEPPLEVLARMQFLRLHLDPNTRENGAMEIALGSYQERLTMLDPAEVARRFEVETCEADPGDILALNMLMLHRSGSSHSEAPRRVLRLDLADSDLPAPLRWAV